MKHLAFVLMLVSSAVHAEMFSIIPDKTETPFFRIYESVRIKQDKNVARVSTSMLVREHGESDPARQWSLSVGYDSLEIPLEFYQEVRRLGDAVLQATPGDDSNSFGTAFHIGKGYVLTNQHVLSTSRKNTTECKNFNVKTGDGKDRFKCASVVRCNREADYCVIKLKAWKNGKRAPETLPTLELNPEHEPDRNALYAAIGNPAGEGLHYSRGRGIWRNGARQFVFYAPVHSGNSGGPLLNEAGQLVGLVYAQGQYGVTAEGYNIAVALDWIMQDMERNVPEHDVMSILRP